MPGNYIKPEKKSPSSPEVHNVCKSLIDLKYVIKALASIEKAPLKFDVTPLSLKSRFRIVAPGNGDLVEESKIIPDT